MFLKKWPPVAILDVQKSLCIAFLTISDQYHNFNFCEVFLQNGWPAAENHFRSHFWPFSDQYATFFKFCFTKWLPSAILDVRNSLWITFLVILDQYKFSIFFKKIVQNGCRWPFWMSENHFRSHFWPFQIDTQLFVFLNFWQNGCRRPFWMSEIHFGSHFWPF